MWASPLAIPILAIIGGLTIGMVSVFFGHKEKMRKLDAESNSASNQEIAELRQRIEALEAIVTDEREQLTRKINSL